jgi:hypothetical protein
LISIGLDWTLHEGTPYTVGTLAAACIAVSCALWLTRRRLKTATVQATKRQEELAGLSERLNTRQADSALFDELLADLPLFNVSFMKDFDFANSLNWELVEPIELFYHNWQDARHEFLDQEIEDKKRMLLKRAGEAVHSLAMNTSPQWHGRNAVASAAKLDMPGGYEQHEHEIDEMNNKADAFSRVHEDFIRTARRRLAK